MDEVRTDEELLAWLRDQLTVPDPPAPAQDLRTLFTAGASGVRRQAAPPDPRRRQRRHRVVAGVALGLGIIGPGVAGALPDPAQSAFDWSIDAVGLDRFRAAEPAAPAVLDDDGTSTDHPVEPDGRTFAETVVVPDAADPDDPGVDDPAAVADDARELGTTRADPAPPSAVGDNRTPVNPPTPHTPDEPAPPVTPGPPASAPADPPPGNTDPPTPPRATPGPNATDAGAGAGGSP